MLDPDQLDSFYAEFEPDLVDDIDWGDDDNEPLACGVENPEVCDSCQ